MKSDGEIAQEALLQPIQTIANKLGLSTDDIEAYGKYKAKVSLEAVSRHSPGKLILVTATTPNKAGVGKTTSVISLALGLNKIGKKANIALREPSLGPCFGMKGGATGGGYSQVLPMEDINLHFTGDFHAITSANNLLAALIDNYQYFNRGTSSALKSVSWKRVLDMNDRSLRDIVSGLGGSSNGIPTETGFDITAASEIMAILCLSESAEDLRSRIESIYVGETFDGRQIYVKDLDFAGSIVVLLKDALKPNLVQSMEKTPAFVHGGPFANIAHGCNSIMATRAALSTGEYAVTEAGFGSDLGGEKFFNIKCRQAGFSPVLTVLVTTSQSLKLHGGVPVEGIKQPNIEGLRNGFANLSRHLELLRTFGQTVVIAFNKFPFDTDEEIEEVKNWCADNKVRFAVNSGFELGGEGAIEFAETVVEAIAEEPSAPLAFSYDLEDSIEKKLESIVQKVYGGAEIQLSKKARTSLKRIQKLGLEGLPVCIAKTQYSFSDDPNATGSARDFTIHFEDLVINSGARFIVAVAGEMMRMPGLPKVPQALNIDLVDGKIVGLS